MTGTFSETEIAERLRAEMTPAVRGLVESLVVRNRDQRLIIERLQSIIERQEKELREQRDMMTALRAEIEQLKSQVKRLTPANSSVPPSTQHPHAKPPKSAGSAGDSKQKRRKRGGQPGHPKHERELIPTEQCQNVIACVPEGCRRCGREFSNVVVDPEPLRRQVWDVEIRTVVTEYQQHRCICEHCGTSTCGQVPEHVVTGTGPVLTAILMLLTGGYRVSRSKAADFATTVCGVPCSTAHVSDLEQHTQEVLAPVYQELGAAVPSEARLKIDETPFRRGTVKTWLWTFVAVGFTVFRLAATRKAKELTTIIGEAYAGVIHCDRAKMYFRFERLQWCWAHLKRDFQRLIDSDDGQSRCLGRALMKEVIQLFHEHHRFRDGQISFEQLQTNLAPVRQRVEDLLLRGHGTAADGMCRELFHNRQHLWTFLADPLVEPTNNGGERSLRHGVIWRKLSFGTQSLRGDRYVETMLSLIETCRQQKRNVFQYLVLTLTTRQPQSLLPKNTSDSLPAAA